jgi:hypothetical protein
LVLCSFIQQVYDDLHIPRHSLDILAYGPSFFTYTPASLQSNRKTASPRMQELKKGKKKSRAQLIGLEFSAQAHEGEHVAIASTMV